MENEFRNEVKQNVETLRNADYEADTVFSHLNSLELHNFIGITGTDLQAIRSTLQLSIELIDNLDVVGDARLDTYCADEKIFVPYHGSCKPALVGTEDEGHGEDCATGTEVIRIHKEWCNDEDCEPHNLSCIVKGNFNILTW
tara:strand:+ start:44 stop:469 length:426 start_codon:yes stop_codon:yes gene_type:complete